MQVVAVGVSSVGSARNPLSPCLVPRCLVVLFITHIITIAFRRRGSRPWSNLRPQRLVCPVRPASPAFFGEDHSKEPRLELQAWSIKQMLRAI